jgi:hypothetical protein
MNVREIASKEGFRTDTNRRDFPEQDGEPYGFMKGKKTLTSCATTTISSNVLYDDVNYDS